MGSRAFRVCSISCIAFVSALGLDASDAFADPRKASNAAPPRLPGSEWLADAQRHIAEREYRASADEVGLQAPNRRHNLRTRFGPTGVRIHDRTGPGSPRLLGLELVGVGRARPLAAVAPGRVVADGARVEIRRPDLVEWFVNSPQGLEQGFTFARRPAGEGPLVLELALSGARARLAGSELRIRTQTGRRLAYGALSAQDADAKPVAAHFEVPTEGRVALVVDDRAARYPLTIDPLLTGTADALLESDQSAALFGGAVAGAGDVNGDGYADVIVGAEEYDAGQLNEGAAFVFLGSADGIDDAGAAAAATQLEGNQSGALFGSTVAGAGDVNGDGYADVIVGAQAYDAGTTDEGAAFIFLGSGTGIADAGAADAATQLESDQGVALFGGAVAGACDVNGDGYSDVIVGSEEYNAPSSDEGAAFVFLGSSTGVADGNPTTAPTQLESNQIGALLGGSVACAGDVNGDGYDDVIVGAELYDNGQTDEGAAWVFLGGPGGIADGNPLTAPTQLEANQAASLFGGAVAGAGDVNGDGYADVIVGAETYNDIQSDEGAAWVFYGGPSGIASGNPLTAPTQLESNQISALFGGSVAGAGDVNGDGYADVIVGAIQYDDPTFNEGGAFVFLGAAGGMPDGNPTTALARIESNQSGATLGVVAGAGDVNGDGYADVIVGADIYDNGQTDEGAAWVFLGGAAGIAAANPASAGVGQLEADQAGALRGVSVAGAGDVNGDGYADVIVGASSYDAGQTDEGAAFVFLGSAAGIPDASAAAASAQLESNQAGALFGASVAGAGDVNGDGYADVIVGSEAYDAGQTDEGAAFVFLGSIAGIPDATAAAASAQLESDQAGALLGRSVAGAGDVNGDGYADVIVGASSYDAGQTDEGAAFVFQGSAAGIADATPASAGVAQLEADQAGALLGVSVAGAGDVNGDGYADVIVGASSYDAGQTDEGAAFVFLGSAAGIPDASAAAASAQLESNQAGALFGASVAGAGDVNGDGYADVIVGSEAYDAGQTDEGAAFVFLGSIAGIPDATAATASAQLESDQAGALLGRSVAGAGDVNGDGYADVIVGASSYDAGQTDEGAAFVFRGSAAGIPDATPASAGVGQLEADQAGALLGVSVAGAGDVNGDGYADVIVGASSYDAGQTDEGAAFVFLGSAAGIPDASAAAASAQLESNQAGALFGASVAGAGDVNGDGYADVIVGSEAYDAGQTDEGAAFV